MDSSTLQKVEAQRLKLEENIAELKNSLRHWQTLELDYEGLKEEFELLPDNASTNECLAAAEEFKPMALNETDLQSLVHDPKAGPRTPRQLTHILSKRVEYVVRNVEFVRKQVSDSEKKRNALLLAEDPEHRDEAGLPLTEITEELDDSGQVISSKVNEPAKDADKLADVLERAGVEGLDKSEVKGGEDTDPLSARATAATSSDESDVSEDEAGDVDVEKVSRQTNITDLQPASSQTVFTNSQDTADEAKLRRDMLQYQTNLDEVGAIVAELDMEEGDSEVSYDEDDEDLLIGSDIDTTDESSEDETGKSKNSHISASYKRKMEELEKKLGLKDMKNVGPQADSSSETMAETKRPSAAEAARQAAISREKEARKTDGGGADQSTEPATRPKPKKAKKSVAFADSLDIAKEEPSKTHQPPSKALHGESIHPVGDTIIERSSTTSQGPAPAPAPPTFNKPKPSRFKQQAQQQRSLPQPPPPTFSPGQLVRSQLHEHAPSTTSSSTTAPAPDTLDTELHRREIALDYHRLRNRKIHAQGGFVRDDDIDEEDFEHMQDDWGVEDEDGNVRRISRFKAARLKR